MFIFTQNKSKLVNLANVLDIYISNGSVWADEIGGHPVCLGTYPGGNQARLIMGQIKAAITAAQPVFDMPKEE